MHKAPRLLHASPGSSLRLLGASTYRAAAGQDFPRHWHSAWEITYYKAGQIGCTIGETLYLVEPGMILMTPPDTPHTEHAWTAYENIYFSVDAPADQPWPREYRDDASGSTAAICSAVLREHSGRGQGRDAMLAALLMQLDILLRRANERFDLTASERLVRDAEHLIEERWSARVTIAEVAREVGSSPSHLRAEFARLRGYSPLAYLHSARLRHSLAMLRTSTLTLDAVATVCGYDSASHLSRHVKRATGKSPGALRDSAAVEQ
jgi:AraC-like DNA-binding protein